MNPIQTFTYQSSTVRTVERDGDFCTIRIEDLQAYEQDGWKDAMVVYYVAGKLIVDDNIGAIRERAASYL